MYDGTGWRKYPRRDDDDEPLRVTVELSPHQALALVHAVLCERNGGKPPRDYDPSGLSPSVVQEQVQKIVNAHTKKLVDDWIRWIFAPAYRNRDKDTANPPRRVQPWRGLMNAARRLWQAARRG